MENLSGGDCCCHCDGGKTKSTPSLLALGLGWSLIILEHSLNPSVKNNANMKGVWVFDITATNPVQIRTKVVISLPMYNALDEQSETKQRRIEGQKYA